MSFEADLEQFARRVGKSLDETCRSVAIKWFSSTVMSTPVDTGRLRGNWMITRERQASGTSARTDPTGSSVVADITRSVGGVGTVNYLTNNLDYAEKIEFGGSNQAPRGMVRVNHARILRIIKQVAAENQV